ncbi:MAG: N-acetyltransferase family protein [Eubacteriales bacterium]
MTGRMEYVVRVAEEKDMERLTEIYAHYVENTHVSFEYVPPSVEEFTGRYVEIIKKFPYLVAEYAGEIVGYAYANTFKVRKAYEWCVETTVYLDRNFQGKGAGTALYDVLEGYLKEQNILNLYACISYPYPLSIDFHEKRGYKQIAYLEECGYKFGIWHDMVWLEKIIGKHTLGVKPIVPFAEYRLTVNV